VVLRDCLPETTLAEPSLRDGAAGEKSLSKRRFECGDCGHSWRVPHGSPKPETCPECEGTDIRRAEEDRSQGKERRRRSRDTELQEDI
jgi:rubrerythrin